MAATPEWVSGGGRRGEHQRSLGGGGQRLRSGNAGKKAAGHAGTAEPRWKGGERRASLRHWHSRGSGEGVLTCGEKREPDLGWETEGANETACAQEGCCHDGRARQTLVRQLQGWGRGAHASSSLHSMSLTRSRRAVALPPPRRLCRGGNCSSEPSPNGTAGAGQSRDSNSHLFGHKAHTLSSVPGVPLLSPDPHTDD